MPDSIIKIMNRPRREGHVNPCNMRVAILGM